MLELLLAVCFCSYVVCIILVWHLAAQENPRMKTELVPVTEESALTFSWREYWVFIRSEKIIMYGVQYNVGQGPTW